MEARTVIIVNSKTQDQKVLTNSVATTLGQLKAELSNAGISYQGATFFEGRSRAEFKDDEAILPTSIEYKGQTYRDLLFMLTTPEKKITSGSMNRKEAYAAIKKLGLEDLCKTKFGQNFTRCKTTDLIKLVKNHSGKTATVKTVEVKEEKSSCMCANIKAAFGVLVNALIEDEALFDSDVLDTINATLDGKIATPKDDGKLSKSELKDILGSYLG